MSVKLVFLLFALFLGTFSAEGQTCQHGGGPVKQNTIINYVRSLIKPLIPANLPGMQVKVDTGFSFTASQVILSAADFDTADMQLVQDNTVMFSLAGLKASVSLNWEISTGPNNSTSGTAQLTLDNCKGSTTAVVETDHFQNTAATFIIGDLQFTASNYPIIQPYWELFKPVVIDTLQREIPNLILEFNTEEIKTLVMPVVTGLEPVHIPPINQTVLGVYVGFTNLTISGIDFTAATMGRGNTNEVVFELTDMSALVTNGWEFRGLGIDKIGTGHISIISTSVSVYVGLGEDAQGEFTINLDNSKIVIGDLDIHIDGGDGVILNFLIAEFKPILIASIEASFQGVLCFLFNGIPS